MRTYAAPAATAPLIFVVEDDPDASLFVERALSGAGYAVRMFPRPDLALKALDEQPCSLLLSDVRLPGMTGLELLAKATKLIPTLPVVLMTAFATLDDAIFALRNGADDYLLKPLTAGGVVGTVADVLAARRQRRNRVLAIGAHPDDVEIGVGATLAGHVDRGDDVTILTLSAGASGGAPSERALEAQEAARLLGAGLMLGDLPDTNIPENGPTVALIEEAVRRVNPTVVYTHSINDVHQDHRAAHRASIVACRWVPQVFSYQWPSARVNFAPHRFVPADDVVDRKLAAIAAYKSQTEKCAYLAEDLLRATTRYWGRYVASDHAEPLEIIREQAIDPSPTTTNQTTTPSTPTPNTPTSPTQERNRHVPANA